MRDYTKSGMTIPHSVQAAVLKGFFRRRPEMGQSAARFFKEQQLYFKLPDGSWELKRPDTGSPLGMFVEGYTIFQYALHNLNLSQISAPGSHFQFSATNDDMVLGGNDPDEIEEYNLADERNNSALGMSYKDTKSGVSHYRFVYCEEYWNGEELDPKSSLFAVTMIGAKHCTTTFHAKEYCHAIMLAAERETPAITNALHEIQSYWGYEFHEDEFWWPYLFGGWLPQIKKGIDYSIEWYNGDLKASAGYWANQLSLRKKGQLSDVPHLTIGRKLGIKLLKEPEDPSIWLDLVPLLGSKRALEYHYRTGSSNPRSVLKEYLLLGKLRRERYSKMIAGKWDIPSVYDKYWLRHPNSVFLDAMPGVVTEPALSRVTTPRLGVRERGFIPALVRMRALGFVDFDGFKTVSRTSVLLAEKGVTQPLQYKYLPVGHSGVSTAILSTYFKGYLAFYERTGRVIVSMSGDDAPLPESRLWPYMPVSSLLTVHRMYRYMQKSVGHEPNTDDLVRAGEAMRQISIEDSQDYASSSDESDSEAPITDAVLLIGEMVRDVIRDWVQNPDDIISSMRGRIIGRVQGLQSKEASTRLEALTTHNVSLLPDASQGSEPIEGLAGGSDTSEVFDPWGELGV
jgi:hypothetical protein